jgi:murein L,D-transpeptidase YafK
MIGLRNRGEIVIAWIALLFFLGPSFANAKVDLVFVKKSERKLYLYEGDKILKAYHIALGANPKGHKQEEGDEKTP